MVPDVRVASAGFYDNQFILRMEYLYGLDSVKIEFG